MNASKISGKCIFSKKQYELKDVTVYTKDKIDFECIEYYTYFYYQTVLQNCLHNEFTLKCRAAKPTIDHGGVP